jgi:hypothetical protein
MPQMDREASTQQVDEATPLLVDTAVFPSGVGTGEFDAQVSTDHTDPSYQNEQSNGAVSETTEPEESKTNILPRWIVAILTIGKLDLLYNAFFYGRNKIAFDPLFPFLENDILDI